MGDEKKWNKLIENWSINEKTIENPRVYRIKASNDGKKKSSY